MMKSIKKRGFTDRLYFYNLIAVWIYTVLCLVFSVLGGRIGIDDYSFVSIVCPLVWGELGVHTGFVVTKARIENINKNLPLESAGVNINIDI